MTRRRYAALHRPDYLNAGTADGMPEADGDDPAPQDPDDGTAESTDGPAPHRLRLGRADIIVLEGALAARLLSEVGPDGMWTALRGARRIAAEVQVYERLRRARLSGEVGRGPPAAVGPELIADLRSSLAQATTK